MKNMKGFIFTLDAVFALIVAVAGISILLYVHSTTNSAYSIPVSEASSILQNLAGMKVSSLYNLGLASNISANGAAAYTWPQFGGNSNLTSSSTIGPKSAYTIFTFNTSNAAIQSVVAADGMVFAASGDYIFAINAATGKQIYSPVNGQSTIELSSTPTIYNNELIYANSTPGSLNAINIYNGSKIWSSTAIGAVDTPMLIEDGYITFGVGSYFYVINPINGSVIASNTVPSPLTAMAPVYANGEFIVTTTGSSAQNYIYTYALVGHNLLNLWRYALSTAPTTMPLIVQNKIIVGSGSTIYSLTFANTTIATNSLNAQINGIASDGNNIYVETASKIYAFNASGKQIFSYPTTTQNQDTTPSIADGNIYTLINGNIYQAYNISDGAILWNVTLPTESQSQYANIALAYGNAYIASGTVLYALGSYKVPPNTNMLSALAGMYLNNQGELANKILNAIYPSQNVGIFINNTYAPAFDIATFNGSYSSTRFSSTSYIFGTAHGIDGTNYNFTIAMWVRPYPNPSTANSWTIPFFSMQSYQAFGFLSSGAGLVLHRCSSADTSGSIKGMSTQSIFNNNWHFVAVSVAYPNYYWQFDGNNTTDTNTNSYSSNNHISIGAQYMQCDGNQFNGQIANVQLYNTALKPQQIMNIYKEGIYGTPIVYSNLSGWWPLIDGINDYGNNYGVVINNNTISNPGILPQTLSNAYLISKASTPLSVNVNGTSRIYNVSVVVWR